VKVDRGGDCEPFLSISHPKPSWRTIFGIGADRDFASSRRTSTELFAAKSSHGVDGGGAASGNDAGKRGNSDENERYRQNHERVARAALDPARDQPVEA